MRLYHSLIRSTTEYKATRSAIVIAALSCLTAIAGAVGVTARAENGVDSYRLKTNDRVRVVVFGHEDLSGEFAVDESGRLSLPLIQYVEALSLTTDELERAISDKLKPDYLKNPRVSVDILSLQPVYVIGEVRQPGSYQYSSGMTVLNAVALAGGYTYRASKKKTTVLQANGPAKKKVRVDEDSTVQPGDVIEIAERFF
ncbi:MAG: polysaccharide export protein [Gammaproteobacteria bacterium]|nr:polysaccharide export protein [Gammaproteobacteria bacterium]MDH3767668.1 polysaccharide export protein [Gammaproteobacteria bacterium]